MDWAANVDTAAFAAVVSAVGGVLVPRIIERVPEPEPDPEEQPEDGAAPRFEGGETAPAEPPKEPYVDIAARPGLLGKSVVATLVLGGLVGLALGWTWALLVWLPLVPVATALAIIDWRTRLLPTW